MKFKKEKEELEKRFNQALQEPKTGHVKKFKCEFCDYCEESEARLTRHMKKNPYRDQTCQTSACDNSEERSESVFSEYPCFYCGYKIRTKESLQRHLYQCHETGLVITNCEDPEAPGMNDAMESYLSHLQTITDRVLKCDICQQTFEYETLFGMHMIFSHPGRLI